MMNPQTRVRRSAAMIVVAVLAGGLATVWAADAASEVWTAPARAARKVNPVAPDAASIAAGQTLFEKNCVSCHGATGKGNGPAAKDLQKAPGDLSNAKLWEQTDGALFWKLTTGKTPMPTFETLATEEQRWQIVNYVRTLAPKPAAATSQPSK